MFSAAPITMRMIPATASTAARSRSSGEDYGPACGMSATRR